jgi:cytochrome b6-f complex iron-sulfur subunit
MTHQNDLAAADRRGFLQNLSSAGMAFGLVVSYGTFGAIAFRYLYPAREARRVLLFVSDLASIAPGGSLAFTAPDGQVVAIARLSDGSTAADFIALSSVCPHLGCRVHWESQNDRFFCPCHNGAFDRNGNATEGPPKDAGQKLTPFALQVQDGLLFVEIPLVDWGDPG